MRNKRIRRCGAIRRNTLQFSLVVHRARGHTGSTQFHVVKGSQLPARDLHDSTLCWNIYDNETCRYASIFIAYLYPYCWIRSSAQRTRKHTTAQTWTMKLVHTNGRMLFQQNCSHADGGESTREVRLTREIRNQSSRIEWFLLMDRDGWHGKIFEWILAAREVRLYVKAEKECRRNHGMTIS